MILNFQFENSLQVLIVVLLEKQSYLKLILHPGKSLLAYSSRTHTTNFQQKFPLFAG